jgi:hypothetical protein
LCSTAPVAGSALRGGERIARTNGSTEADAAEAGLSGTFAADGQPSTDSVDRGESALIVAAPAFALQAANARLPSAIAPASKENVSVRWRP